MSYPTAAMKSSFANVLEADGTVARFEVEKPLLAAMNGPTFLYSAMFIRLDFENGPVAAQVDITVQGPELFAKAK
jgi:hypothetical protein